MTTTTAIEYLVDCVDALDERQRHAIPHGQASSGEAAVETVRQFCRPSACFPLKSVTHVGTRTTVLTMLDQ